MDLDRVCGIRGIQHREHLGFRGSLRSGMVQSHVS